MWYSLYVGGVVPHRNSALLPLQLGRVLQEELPRRWVQEGVTGGALTLRDGVVECRIREARGLNCRGNLFLHGSIEPSSRIHPFPTRRCAKIRKAIRMFAPTSTLNWPWRRARNEFWSRIITLLRLCIDWVHRRSARWIWSQAHNFSVRLRQLELAVEVSVLYYSYTFLCPRSL